MGFLSPQIQEYLSVYRNTHSAFGSRSAAQCPEKPVALCDWPRCLLVATSQILVTAHSGRRRGPAQDQAAEDSGILREPCRDILMQSGRWIFK